MRGFMASTFLKAKDDLCLWLLGLFNWVVLLGINFRPIIINFLKTLSILPQVFRFKCTNYWCIWQYYMWQFLQLILSMNRIFINLFESWGGCYHPNESPAIKTSKELFMSNELMSSVNMFCLLQVWTAIYTVFQWRALKVMVPLSSNFISFVTPWQLDDKVIIWTKIPIWAKPPFYS